MDRSLRRRFFLADPEAQEPHLLPEEERHASSVLRVRAGERILGLDGKGGLHPLLVRRASGRTLELERDGPIEREPAPGAAGAPAGWILVAAPLPKGTRAEEMLDRLTQLGLAELQPLRCARNQGFEREAAEVRAPRLLRACMEACKQSRRAWLPVIHPTVAPEELCAQLRGTPSALLAPESRQTLLQWSGQENGDRFAVIAGPEGGFDAAELASLDFAAPVTLAPHVLRIETAVEAAVATLAQVGYARGLRS